MAQTTIDELSRADEAFAGNRLLSTFSREARALIEPFGEMIELGAGDIVLTRGDQVRASLFPVGSDDDLDDDRVKWRPLCRGRIGWARRRGWRYRKLRPCTGFLARGGTDAGRSVQGADGRAGGCQGPLAIHRQPLLPIFRLSAVAGNAISRLQRVSFNPGARRALAAPCAGSRRRPHRADAGSVRRTARACSGPRSTRSSRS